MAAIKKEHFDGLKNVSEAGSSGNKLSEILRGFVDEVTDRIQSGSTTLVEDGNEIAVVFSPAMPDTYYDVSIAHSEDPTDLLKDGGGTQTLNAFFVKAGASRTANGFTIGVKGANAGGAVAEGMKIEWIARSRTRVHTKG